MKIKKIFILFTMLLAGLSFKGANSVEKNVVADAAEAGSYAYLYRGWKNDMKSELSAQGFTDYNLIKSILITNKEIEITSRKNLLDGCPVEVGRNTPREYYTNGCAIGAYLYPNGTNETGTTMYDCILYANVETIYPLGGNSLFGCLRSLEKITFDCKFSMANANVDYSMYRMFEENYVLKQIEGLENLDTTNVTDMSYMFVHCHSLKTLDLSRFDTSKVTTIKSMFSSCREITTITGFENWDTSNVTNMDNIFGLCREITTITGLENWNTSKVTDMGYMFQGCNKLTILDRLNGEKWDTSKVTNMVSMFNGCSSLTSLDLSNFDLSSILDNDKLNYILGSNKTNLKELKMPKNMNGLTIQLPDPNNFGMDKVDSSMEGWTLLEGSKNFNILLNTLMKINVCTEYAQASELQTMYDGLSTEEKNKLATLTDAGGVILTDKLSYMVSYADYKANEAMTASGTHLVLSAKTGQYLVIVIACLSLSLIGGYYFIQKKKYAK